MEKGKEEAEEACLIEKGQDEEKGFESAQERQWEQMRKGWERKEKKETVGK